MLSVISNTILATTVFLFFLLPGFILLRSFWQSDKGNLHSTNIYNYLIWGTPLSALLYFISILIFNYFLYPVFNLQQVPVKEVFTYIFDSQKSLGDVSIKTISVTVLFLFFTSLISFLIGSGSRDFIIDNYLDLEFQKLKFRNEWFYLLTARGLNFTEVKIGKEKKEKGEEYKPKKYSVEVDFLCKVGDSIIFYKGIVEDYKLKDESLEYIYLKYVTRTLINGEETKPLKSDMFEVTIPKIDIDESFTVKGKIYSSFSDNDVVDDEAAANGKEMIAQIDASQEEYANPVEHAQMVLGESSQHNPIASKKFYSIDGDTLVFKFSEILNINIIYKEIK